MKQIWNDCFDILFVYPVNLHAVRTYTIFTTIQMTEENLGQTVGRTLIIDRYYLQHVGILSWTECRASLISCGVGYNIDLY